MRSKLPNVGTTIFSVMTALANSVGAVNCSQGFPDYDVDPELSALLTEASRQGANQYAPMPGTLALRQAVALKYRTMFSIDVDQDEEITITAGGTAALATAIMATVSNGQNVIIFEPAYDSYEPCVLLQGAQVRRSQLLAPAYRPDWDHVRSLVDDNTALIIINSPHNPCGSVLQKEDLDELATIVRNTNIAVLSDEVYELITFDGRCHLTLAKHEELWNRCFIVTSFGKTFHCTGWKVGACIAPKHLTEEFRKVHQFMSFCVNAPAQTALAMYMEKSETYSGLSAFMEKKRDLFRSLLEGSSWTIRPCEGSYFQLLGYERFSNEQDTDLAVRLTKEIGVASIPLSPFLASRVQPDTVLRFCFAKRDETLRAAAERLRSL